MSSKKILVGLGNPLMCDDAIGIVVSERVHRALKDYEIELGCRTGLDVVERIIGYNEAVIIDSMITKKVSPGSVVKIRHGEGMVSLRCTHSHGMGLFQAIELARKYGARLPSIVIYGIEVEDPYTLREGLTQSLRMSIDRIVKQIVDDIERGAHKSA